MGFFKKRLVSKDPVNVWSTGDVYAWAKVMALPKACRTALKPVDGERLLNSTPQDLRKLVEGQIRPEQLELLIRHVNTLKVENGFAPTFDAPERALLSAQNPDPLSGSVGSGPVSDPNVMVLIQDPARPLSAESSHALDTTPTPKSFGFLSPTAQAAHDASQAGAGGNTADGVLSDLRLNAAPRSAAKAASPAALGAENGGRDPDSPGATPRLPSHAALQPAAAAADNAPLAASASLSSAAADEDDGARAASAASLAQSGVPSRAVSPDLPASPELQASPAGSPAVSAEAAVEEDAAGEDEAAAEGELEADLEVLDEEEALESSAPFGSIAQSALLTVEVDGLDGGDEDGRPESLRQPQTMRSAEQTEFLATQMGDGITPRDLEAFLTPLERTRGLVDLVTEERSAAGLLAAIYRTYSDCFHAVPCAQNAAHLQDFCLALVTVLEAAGKRGATLGQKLIEDMTALFVQASELVNNFSTGGWFLHMAFMENIKGRFDAVHNDIVHLLQSARLATLPSGKTLTAGDYKDPARAVRRVLKQLGAGSVANGIYKVVATESYRDKLAMILEVHKGDLVSELDKVPHGDQAVDLHDLYDSLVAGKAEAGTEAVDTEEHCKIFAWYDKGSKGYMTHTDLKSVLTDLGLLDTIRDKDQFVSTQMTMASKGAGDTLTETAFCAYYGSLVHLGERHQLRIKLGIEAENELMAQFQSFANYGVRADSVAEIDGSRFAKYARDCRLLTRTLTSTDVDLVFARVKPKSARTIDFDTFLRALHMISEKRGQSFVDLVKRVLRHDSPPLTKATRTNNVRLHDDKSTYTGVYSRGGPTNLDLINSNDLRYLTDRSKADPRGVKLNPPSARMSLSRTPSAARSNLDSGTPTAGTPSHRARALQSVPTCRPSMGSLGGSDSMASQQQQQQRRLSKGPSQMSQMDSWTPSGGRRTSAAGGLPSPSRTALRPGLLSEAKEAFVAFAQFGKRAEAGAQARKDVLMDGRAFAKLCKEAGLLNGKLDATRVDLTFTKCADKLSKRMSFKQFQEALADCARFKGDAPERVFEAVARCEGPMLQGTVQAESVRLHDDRRTYTGVYAQGGPTNVDHPTTLEGMVNRQTADYVNRRESTVAASHRKAFA